MKILLVCAAKTPPFWLGEDSILVQSKWRQTRTNIMSICSSRIWTHGPFPSCDQVHTWQMTWWMISLVHTRLGGVKKHPKPSPTLTPGDLTRSWIERSAAIWVCLLCPLIYWTLQPNDKKHFKILTKTRSPTLNSWILPRAVDRTLLGIIFS